MSNSNHIYTSPDRKTSAYEKMQDGKSYAFIYCDGEEVRIPMKYFRELMNAWSLKKWSDEWDTLAVTDQCFLGEEE
jgi:hypothetical protein